MIELMIAVVIVGILAAIAIPAYTDHIRRGKIPEATASLSDVRVRMEQWFQDNRDYSKAGGPCAAVWATKNFGYKCSNLGMLTYMVTATGTGSMSGFAYTIDQTGAKTTVSVGSGWKMPTVNNCWATKEDGSC